LGTKPLTVGKQVWSSETVLKALVDADGNESKAFLAALAHTTHSTPVTWTNVAQMLDVTAAKLGVDREALADYLVGCGWMERAGSPDRIRTIHKLESSMIMPSELNGSHQTSDEILKECAQAFNLPLAVFKFALAFSHTNDPQLVTLRKQMAEKHIGPGE